MDKKTIVYYLYHLLLPIVFLETFTWGLTLGGAPVEVSDAIVTFLIILFMVAFEVFTLRRIKHMRGLHLFLGWILSFVTFYLYIVFFSV